MSADASIELLERVARASDEQKAAIERFLGGEPLPDPPPHAAVAPRRQTVVKAESRSGVREVLAHLARIERTQKAQTEELKAEMRKAVAEAMKPTAAAERPIDQGEAARVFRLFGELLGMGTDLVAPPARVFDLMVFKKMTKAETSLECKCVASLITKRVALIERHFAMPIERLRAFASDLKERQRTVKGDRYARKKHGAARDDLEPQDGDERPGAMEDDGGYLPEEKQNCE